MQRLAVFTDGTWNDEADQTNVLRLSKWVAPVGTDGVPQLAKYIPGVGTKPFQRLLGGAVGEGLSANVREAYQWLRENYVDGDQIYLFGFSRGAYTARSIAGLIATCGLLQKTAPMSIEWVYERYRERKTKATPIYKLEYLRTTNERPLTPDETQLLTHSRRVKIHMIGVWDTVGALGIPWTGMPLIGKQNFFFHNPNLSVIHEHAFQAMAIDEHRGAYKPTLWTLFAPAENDTAPVTAPTMPSELNVSPAWRGDSRVAHFESTSDEFNSPNGALCQNCMPLCWFVGAHSNVGGGYKNDPLPKRPLVWLQSKAAALGLTFTQVPAVSADDLGVKPVDSYGKFMLGIYRILKFGRRFYRPIGIRRNKVKGGWSYPVNETIDDSVFERCRVDAAYPRDNLLAWAQSAGVTRLADVRGTQAGYRA